MTLQQEKCIFKLKETKSFIIYLKEKKLKINEEDWNKEGKIE